MNHRDVFSQNLNRKMKELNKTRKDICDAIEISYFTVTDWVKGKKMPRMDKIEKLAQYFDCSISELVEKKDDEQLEMQKRDNELSALILKLKEDDELLDIMDRFDKLDASKRAIIVSILDAFLKNN